eukprot:3678679-Pyramimonas_sp.AAC.1
MGAVYCEFNARRPQLAAGLRIEKTRARTMLIMCDVGANRFELALKRCGAERILLIFSPNTLRVPRVGPRRKCARKLERDRAQTGDGVV